MIADDHVAYAPDEDAEGHARSGGVEHFPGVEPQSAGHREGQQDGAEDAAEQRDAALPHLEHAEDIAGVVTEVVDDVRQTGADERADGGPDQHRVDGVLADALAGRLGHHQPGAEQEADGDPDPVGRDAERSEQDVDDRVVADGARAGPAQGSSSCVADRVQSTGWYPWLASRWSRRTERPRWGDRRTGSSAGSSGRSLERTTLAPGAARAVGRGFAAAPGSSARPVPHLLRARPRPHPALAAVPPPGRASARSSSRPTTTTSAPA